MSKIDLGNVRKTFNMLGNIQVLILDRVTLDEIKKQPDTLLKIKTPGGQIFDRKIDDAVQFKIKNDSGEDCQVVSLTIETLEVSREAVLNSIVYFE